MPRNPKYPDAETTIQSFFQSVSDSYRHPGKDEVGDVSGRKKQELLAEEFGISRLKVRKILITTGDITYPQTAQIQEILKETVQIDAACNQLRISRSTLNSYLPYSKGVYKLTEVSAAAERTALYRSRKEVVEQLKEKMNGLTLWKTVCLFEDYPFVTSDRGKHDGVKFKYTISGPGSSGGRHYSDENVDDVGNELFIINSRGEKRDKSITRSSVDYAFKIAMEGNVTGPKSLKIYGASYVYAMFARFGVV